MTSPVPGFAAPNPRTWGKGDFITAPRLRADMTNLAYLFAGGARPMLLAGNFQNQIPNVGSATGLQIGNNVALNTWNVSVFPPGAPAVVPYAVPLAGYWLLQGDVTFTLGGSPGGFKNAMGFTAVVNGAGAGNTDGGAVPETSAAGDHAGVAGCELYQFNTNANTGDQFNMYVFQNNSNPGIVYAAFLMAEWVGLPTSGLTGYTGPYGTVVSSPQPAAPFPSGPGTFITNGGGIAAGATSVTVNDATGMITGGTLGLDWYNGQQFAPVAEAVTITGVAGTTISISATAYAHLQNAPVAVPVSAAFLNQQSRDLIRFLAYPPLLRAAPGGTQAITAAAFPAGTQIGLLATIDNFSGFSGNAYTVPVSGTYLVYGQVYWAGSNTAFAASAGIQQNSGTIQWGTLFRSNTLSGAQSLCTTVRRVLRLAKGDTIKLFGFVDQNMSTVASGATFSKLICVFRSL